MIEQGRAGFEARAHGAAVYFNQQIVRQILRNIPPTHFLNIVVRRFPANSALTSTANSEHDVVIRLPLRHQTGVHLRQTLGCQQLGHSVDAATIHFCSYRTR
ncbi:hypothetical protein D3C72_1111650 [compost metagenome]